MNTPQQSTTCWMLIREAVDGKVRSRDAFVALYEPVIRAYLSARWRGTKLEGNLDDAAQDVFLEFFRIGGALEKADEQRGGFRAYLFGIVKNIASRHEQKVRKDEFERNVDCLAADDTSLAIAFDRAWALSLVKEAGRVSSDEASEIGTDAVRRVELLRLRFHNGIPIRDIAKKWNVPSEFVHRQYATARKEFRESLRKVVAFQRPGSSDAEIETSCREILQLL